MTHASTGNPSTLTIRTRANHSLYPLAALLLAVPGFFLAQSLAEKSASDTASSPQTEPIQFQRRGSSARAQARETADSVDPLSNRVTGDETNVGTSARARARRTQEARTVQTLSGIRMGTVPKRVLSRGTR